MSSLQNSDNGYWNGWVTTSVTESSPLPPVTTVRSGPTEPRPGNGWSPGYGGQWPHHPRNDGPRNPRVAPRNADWPRRNVAVGSSRIGAHHHRNDVVDRRRPRHALM